MGLSKERILGALELRYDYYSARAVLRNTLAHAGIADKESYSDEELEMLCQVLLEDVRSESLVARLRRWAGLSGPPVGSADIPPAGGGAAVPPAPLSPDGDVPPAGGGAQAAPEPIPPKESASPGRESAQPGPEPIPPKGGPRGASSPLGEVPAKPAEGADPPHTGTGATAATGEVEVPASGPDDRQPMPADLGEPEKPEPETKPTPPQTGGDVAAGDRGGAEPTEDPTHTPPQTGGDVAAGDRGGAEPTEDPTHTPPQTGGDVAAGDRGGGGAPSHVDVAIHVRNVPVVEGAMLVMVGNLDEIGAWIPDDGFLLDQVDDSDAWRGTLRVPADSTLEFKFVRVGDATPVWEGGDNRTLDIGAQTHRLHTTWQS